MPSSDPQSNAPLKRRACDECRSRKLACTKEPDGCTRCVREGIRCHYSEQKPMGRPRKRQANGVIKDSNLDFQSIVPEFETLPFLDDNFQIDPFPDIDAFQFLNDFTDLSTIPLDQALASGQRTVEDGRPMFEFGRGLSFPIDFGIDDLSPDSVEPEIVTLEKSVHRPSAVFAGDHPAPTTLGPPCSCLATMYLAMSSLQEFPSEVESALATVRAAANTAQASIRCPKCGHCAAITVTPPIEAFQNTMLLGTILPIIANGYKRLLVLVDGETEKAKALGIKKVFRMSAYGGLCSTETICSTVAHLNEAVMEPDDWRTAVRGLLRVDVYGMDGVTSGLRGIISEMEQRQRLRHGEWHRLHENNLSAHATITGEHQCLNEKDMLCVRMLDTAKIAIDTLVIA